MDEKKDPLYWYEQMKNSPVKFKPHPIQEKILKAIMEGNTRVIMACRSGRWMRTESAQFALPDFNNLECGVNVKSDT